MANTKKATVALDISNIRVQVNLYRNMNGATQSGIITVSAFGDDATGHVGTLMALDVDITKDLTPAQRAALTTLLDAAEAWAEARWGAK